MNSNSPPASIDDLCQRARALAGQSIATLAQRQNITVPTDLRQHKGWQGQLIEMSLGASAGSKPLPDFPKLGIELKTIPINQQHKPCETTFVASIPLLTINQETWQTSLVRKKLARVLWVPIEGDRAIPLAQRKIGMPLLWEMDAAFETVLQRDWEELTEMICLGQLEKITARLGTYLHVRPKAANAKSLCWGIGQTGEKILTLPRGFYLRTMFTRELLAQYYA